MKDLKTNTSKEDGSDNTTSWSEEVITCLKTIESHASWNVLRMWQHMFDGHAPPISFHSSNLIDLNACDAPPISFTKPSSNFISPKKLCQNLKWYNNNLRTLPPWRSIGRFMLNDKNLWLWNCLLALKKIVC